MAPSQQSAASQLHVFPQSSAGPGMAATPGSTLFPGGYPQVKLENGLAAANAQSATIQYLISQGAMMPQNGKFQTSHLSVGQGAAGPYQLPRLFITQQGSTGLLSYPQQQMQMQIPSAGLLATSMQGHQQMPLQLRLQPGQQLQMLSGQQCADLAAATDLHSQQISGLQLASQPNVGTSSSPMMISPSDVHSSQRAAQLARYRHKRLVRLRAQSEGKKIRYQCRKTLADARPRVKGRFAKVHTDSSGGSSPKAGATKSKAFAKGNKLHQCMSAVDLGQLNNAMNAYHRVPKVEDLDEFGPAWWLGETTNPSDTENSNQSGQSLLDDIVDGELRKCYSETNLLQFEGMDMQAALEVLQTEQSFNTLCAGIP